MEKISSILKYFLVLVAFAFVVPLFVACGENYVPATDVRFLHDNKIVIAQGESVQLKWAVYPIEASNKIVRFKVTNAESDKYITVDSNGLVTAITRTDKTEVTANVAVVCDYGSGLISDTIDITIRGEPQALKTPTNLKYDDKTSSLVWDAMTETGVNYNPSYELQIKKDRVGLETVTVSQNSYKITEAGKYSVQIKSVVTEGYKTIYKDSDLTTTAYEFEILKSATNAKVENSTICVEKIDDDAVVSYDLHVYKTTQTASGLLRGDEISSSNFSKSFNGNQILWNIPTNLDAGTYEFEVITTSGNSLVFSSIDFKAVQFEKLAIPSNIYLDANVLFWDAVTNATGYNVFVYSEAGDLIKTISSDFEKNGSDFKLNLDAQELNETNYTLKIMAVGNGKEVVDSEISNVATQKLKSVQNLKINGNTLSWSAVANAQSYVLLLNGETKDTVVASTTSYDVSTWEFVSDDNLAGQSANTIGIYAQSLNIYSDTVTIEVNKLPNITLKTNNGNVAWDSVDRAEKYEVVVYDESKTPIANAEIDTNEFSFDKNSDLKQAGKYFVTVRALGNNTNVRDGDVIIVTDKNKDDFAFTKQSIPTITGFNGDGELFWTRGDYALSTSTFEIGVIDAQKDNELVAQINASSTSLNLREYLDSQSSGVLTYQFYVKALNKQSGERYLNSENSDYIIAYKLEAPQNLAVSDGQFVWDAPTLDSERMQSLIGYKLFIKGTYNNSEIVQENFDQRQISPTSSEMFSGTSKVQIKSYVKPNSDSSISNKTTLSDGTVVYVLDSNYSEAKNFTKLGTPSTPTVNNGKITGSAVANATGYEVVLNVNNNGKDGERKNSKTIDGIDNSWSIQISELVDESISFGNYVAKVVALGGNLYINSNFSSDGANIYKLEAPTITVKDGVVTWNQVSSKLSNANAPIKSYQLFYKKSTDVFYNQLPFNNTLTWDMAGYDAGEYDVKIKAISTSDAVVTSDDSDEVPVKKLKGVDASSIKVLGADSGVFDGNIITWNSIGDSASYELKITKPDSTTETRTLTTNQFTFDDTYSGNEYSITLKTVFANAVSGTKTSPITIKRLSAVTGINVSGSSEVVADSQIKTQNYKLSWDEREGAKSYAISINNQELKTIEGSTSTYLIDNPYGLKSEQTGTLNIKIIAKISSENLTQNENVLTISAPASKVCSVYRNVAPSLGVNNGAITINNENASANNNGYTLIFTPTDLRYQTIYINLDGSKISYDMSDTTLAEGQKCSYNVSIIAKGSDGDVLQSEQKYLTATGTGTAINVKKLGSVDSFVVQNGVVKWDIVTGASGFDVTVKSDSNKGTNKGIVSNPASAGTKVEMPTNLFSGLSGNLTFTIQPKGTSGATNTEAYISSNILKEFKVKKLTTPTGLMVKNGEICWTLNEEQDSGTPVVSSYKVLYGSNSQDVNFGDSFILSSYIDTKTSRLAIKVCAIGSKSTTNGGYVSSDYTSDLIVNIAGQPQALNVVDGVLCWKENATDTTSYSDYELELEIDDTTTITLKSNKNSNTLIDVVEDYGYKFKSIRVRHVGTENSTTSAVSGYPSVNSLYSAKLENVQKLMPFSSAEVNEMGVFTWSHATAGVQMMLSLNGGTYVAQTSNTISSLLSSDMLTSILENGYAKFSVSYYPFVPNSRTDTETPLYISGETSRFDAIQFSPVLSAEMDTNGLNVTWTQENRTINGIPNDKIILSYQYSEYENEVEKQPWQEKTFNISELSKVDESYCVPMWNLGYYNFKISVLSSTASTNNLKILRSVATNIDAQKICFNKFASGNGTADNPFVISSTQNVASTESGKWAVEKTSASTKFGYIKSIPSCFFRLAEDITLETYTGSDYLNNNFLGLNSNYVVLTGGIDGQDKNLDENGNVVCHTIKNYWSYDGNGMFAGIVGGTNKNLSASPNSENFFGKTGVLMNLKLEVAHYEIATYSSSSEVKYASILANTMVGGMLYNCEISLSDDFGSNEISVNDSSLQPITFATFVAQAYGSYIYEAGETLTSEYAYRDAVIKNCVSNVDVSIFKRSSKSSIVTKVAGIVGEASGVNIYNCTNNGNLSAVRVAGIALKTDGITTYEGESFNPTLTSSVVGGSQNNGTLNAYALYNGGNQDFSYSAGIVGEATNTFVLNSINNGQINVSMVESKLGVSSSGTHTVIIGGLVAKFDSATVSNDKYSGGFANCFNFGKINFVSDDFGFDINSPDEGDTNFGGLVGNMADGKNISMLTCYYDTTQNSTILAFGNKRIDSQSSVGLSTENIKSQVLQTTSNEGIKNNLIVGDLNTIYFDACSEIVQEENAYPTIKFL